MADGDNQRRSPRARYEADLENDDFQHDPAQAEAVDALEDIYRKLLDRPTSKSLFGKKKRQPVQGLYLWGGVGRGKTYLMDCFFDALPFEEKTRLHFHRFMQKVHEARKRYANQSDPLKLIAKEWSSDRVLCFDEFFVSDVADAMILARLTEELFERGVTLVTTSNVDPDDLYAGGLQRERFLPAIERIKTYCRVMHLADGTDFRLDHIDEAATYQTPADEAADDVLARHFDRLCAREHDQANNVQVLGRKIPVRRRGDSVVWFEFEDLCRGNRSANDYIELAREFPTIMLSNVPVFDDTENNAARRFINAVDEFYDRRVKLFCTAQAGPDDLYNGTRLSFEFERTASRLHEMSSNDYLGESHRS
ncbi:cell division protein ZapE [Salinisphaera sp. T31B1]|uniref:cell division protein ZapE n=1 Tax=Salinisphaera sp. T31B1 TaxID=727963 RepID=UPI00333FCB7F